MPVLIRFLLTQVALGAALGAVFLGGLIAADVCGLGGLLAATAHPLPVVLAAAFSALAPFALGFMATALVFHRWED